MLSLGFVVKVVPGEDAAGATDEDGKADENLIQIYKINILVEEQFEF